ncbi:MAG: hypothetical protein J2P21_30630 [Chloracidobacterium sp.]|nr:hypothetical protein [Chloracidobacterium sp.]
MLRGIKNTHRSNHSIFFPQNFGSPVNDMTEHIAALGLRRLDFERCAVAGEVIYAVEGDSTPTSQQNEEARIATLAHALKKLGNTEDAAENMRCLARSVYRATRVTGKSPLPTTTMRSPGVARGLC